MNSPLHPFIIDFNENGKKDIETMFNQPGGISPISLAETITASLLLVDPNGGTNIIAKAFESEDGEIEERLPYSLMFDIGCDSYRLDVDFYLIAGMFEGYIATFYHSDTIINQWLRGPNDTINAPYLMGEMLPVVLHYDALGYLIRNLRVHIKDVFEVDTIQLSFDDCDVSTLNVDIDEKSGFSISISSIEYAGCFAYVLQYGVLGTSKPSNENEDYGFTIRLNASYTNQTNEAQTSKDLLTEMLVLKSRVEKYGKTFY